MQNNDELDELANFLTEMITKYGEKLNDVCCGNCKYHVHDDNGDGMCVNADSDACADWTDDSDVCGEWSEKGEVTKL